MYLPETSVTDTNIDFSLTIKNEYYKDYMLGEA